MLSLKRRLSGRLQELKNKGKDQLVIPKSGRGRLRVTQCWGPFLESPDNVLGPESYFRCAMFDFKI